MTVEIITKKVCVVDDIEYDITKEFTMIYPGWDCDDRAYIISYQGENRLVTSNHGEFSIIGKDIITTLDDVGKPRDELMLEIQIEALKGYIKKTEDALELLKKQ